MINYEIVPLKGHNQYDLNGVRFDGKSFMFWKKKNVQAIKQVVVIFNKNYENIQINDDMMVLSLKTLNDYQDLYNAMMIFEQILKSNQMEVKFQFIVENENQEKMAEALGNRCRISFVVYNVNKSRDKNLQASGSKTVEVGDKKVTVNDNKAFINSGTLSIEEEKHILLQEWQKDPLMSSKLINMSPVEIDKMLTEAVTSNLKAYRMESANEQLGTNKVGNIAINKASGEDGLVNSELGLVENNVYNPNKYSVVSEKGEGLQVANASVESTTINSGGVTGDIIGNNDVQKYVDSNLEKKEESKKEVMMEFYLDDDYNIYDKDGNLIGKIGQAGYIIDYNDNTLVKNGQKLGYLSDYNDLGKSSNVYSKPNVKTLKKEPENKSFGFVSLPVIMFVLSALLLIGSVVLLFVLE